MTANENIRLQSVQTSSTYRYLIRLRQPSRFSLECFHFRHHDGIFQRVPNKKGFSLIEILIAITIFSIFSIGVFYLSLDTIQRDSKIQFNNEALQYAQEGLEAVRHMRGMDYLSLTNGDHGLQLVGDTWSFIQAPEDINGFYARTITIEDVYRDENGEIAGTGTFDPETKRITSEVTWNWRGVSPQSVSLVTYFSNWTADDWIQDTCTEWNAGVFQDTESVATPGPPTDNCAMELILVEEQSQFFSSANLGEHGDDVVVDGNYAYIAKAKTQEGLSVVDISDPASPTELTSLYVWQKGRYITKSGNTVYMGIQSNNPGIAMVDVSNPAVPSATYAWTIGGYGNEPEVSGNYLYMAVESGGDSFLVYDISGVPFMTDSLGFNDEVHVIEVNGQYAYIGRGDDGDALRVIDISDPYNLQEAASLDVGEEVNAIEISGAVAFVGTEESDNSLQVVNISNPESPTAVTSLDVGGEIQDLVIWGDYLYAAIDEIASGLAVINISNPLAPILKYNLDITGKATGIDTDGSYVYITTNVNNRGLVIIEVLDPGVSTTGVYDSTALDTGGEDTRYNFISWNHTEVPGGSVKFQIRTADTLDNLSTATWVGFDGTNATYYENSRTQIVLDPARTGQRFLQFRAIITSDGMSTPVIESVRINYTP